MHLVKGPLSLLGQLQQTCCGTPEAAFERSIQGTLIPPPGGSRGQTSQALKAETLLSAPTAGRQDTPVPGPWETGWSLPLSWPQCPFLELVTKALERGKSAPWYVRKWRVEKLK